MGIVQRWHDEGLIIGLKQQISFRLRMRGQLAAPDDLSKGFYFLVV